MTTYPLFPDPASPSTVLLVNHLPFAERVRTHEPVGSPAWIAVTAALAAPALAGLFAAHAHAYHAAELASADDAVRREHLGAMHALTLALTVTNPYPISRMEFARLGLAALFEAATGVAFSGEDALPTFQDRPDNLSLGTYWFEPHS